MPPQSSRLSCRRPTGWSAYAGAAQWDGPVAGKSTRGVYLAHPSRDWLDAMGISRPGTPRPPPSKKRFHGQSFFERSECPGGVSNSGCAQGLRSQTATETATLAH
jgi:hypothetical protein